MFKVNQQNTINFLNDKNRLKRYQPDWIKPIMKRNFPNSVKQDSQCTVGPKMQDVEN